MEPIEIIAQAIGIVAMAFNILSYQQKTQKKVIICQLFGCTLFAINFLMLGAIVGAMLNMVGAVRAVVFMNKEKLHSDNIVWLIGFICVYIVSYILTFTVFGKEVSLFNCIIELLPVIGMTATTVSLRYKDAKTIRRFGLISSPSWLIYNIVNFAIGAIICEVLCLGSIIIGIIRLDMTKKNQ